MSDALTLTVRPLYQEDFDPTTIPSGNTVTVNVLSVGAVPLTRVPLTLLTQLFSAANDAAAAAGGVSVGQIYYNTTDTSLHTRMI